MSVEAMTIVLHHSCATGTAKLVLLGIANHEGDGGAWPAIDTLARYANCDPRTAQRAIEKLIEVGELKRHVNEGGDRRTRSDRRPNLYRILTVCPPNCDRSTQHRLVDNSGSRGGAPVTPQAPRGDASVANGVTPVSPEPSSNHPLDHLPAKSPVTRVPAHAHSFDEVSGYCGCGFRDDGRLVDPKTAIEYQAPRAERAHA